MTATPKFVVTWFDSGAAVAVAVDQDGNTTHFDLDTGRTDVADVMLQVARGLGADAEEHNEHHRPSTRVGHLRPCTCGAVDTYSCICVSRRVNLPAAVFKTPHSDRRRAERREG